MSIVYIGITIYWLIFLKTFICNRECDSFKIPLKLKGTLSLSILMMTSIPEFKFQRNFERNHIHDYKSIFLRRSTNVL